MENRVHLIMPMAGRGSRFYEKGFHLPKPLISIYGRPFFFWAVQSVYKFTDIASIDFVILKEHDEKYHMKEVISSYYQNARIHVLESVTEGAVITCLNGISDISDDLPVIFNDCDHLFKCCLFNEYCKKGVSRKIDGILLTFPSDETKYSFIKKDEEGNVTETAEKVPLSQEAVCGCYYFRNSQVFKNAAIEYLRQCEYSEYFMSGIYNVLIANGQTVRSLETDFHISFGVPEEYEEAKKRTEYEELL